MVPLLTIKRETFKITSTVLLRLNKKLDFVSICIYNI